MGWRRWLGGRLFLVGLFKRWRLGIGDWDGW